MSSACFRSLGLWWGPSQTKLAFCTTSVLHVASFTGQVRYSHHPLLYLSGPPSSFVTCLGQGSPQGYGLGQDGVVAHPSRHVLPGQLHLAALTTAACVCASIRAVNSYFREVLAAAAPGQEDYRAHRQPTTAAAVPDSHAGAALAVSSAGVPSASCAQGAASPLLSTATTGTLPIQPFVQSSTQSAEKKLPGLAISSYLVGQEADARGSGPSAQPNLLAEPTSHQGLCQAPKAQSPQQMNQPTSDAGASAVASPLEAPPTNAANAAAAAAALHGAHPGTVAHAPVDTAPAAAASHQLVLPTRSLSTAMPAGLAVDGSSGLEALPSTLLEEVCGHLAAGQLCRVASVSRAFQQVCPHLEVA